MDYQLKIRITKRSRTVLTKGLLNKNEIHHRQSIKIIELYCFLFCVLKLTLGPDNMAIFELRIKQALFRAIIEETYSFFKKNPLKQNPCARTQKGQ